jgi:hypothetical protein
LGGNLHKPRQQTAILTGVCSAFLTFCYLTPMLTGYHDDSATNNKNELATFALYLLSFAAALIGMALGSLLPRPFSGVALGAGFGLFLVTALENAGSNASGGLIGFPMLGGGLGLLGGFVGIR